MVRYDASGRTDDKFADAEEMGWDAYFGQLFERVDSKMLDADKTAYQGMSGTCPLSETTSFCLALVYDFWSSRVFQHLKKRLTI